MLEQIKNEVKMSIGCAVKQRNHSKCCIFRLRVHFIAYSTCLMLSHDLQHLIEFPTSKSLFIVLGEDYWILLTARL